MPYRYRAFAIDYDGTLAAADKPHADVLAAVAAVRTSGRRVILVTGRIMDELLAVFPHVLAHFDHVVAENGCVLVEGGGGRTSLAPEIDAALSSRLRDMAVPHRRGHVLIATQARHSTRVQLPGVVRIGGANPLPAVADVVHILVRAGASVVVDMAQHDVRPRGLCARTRARLPGGP
jgi:hypothetical protein